MQEFSYDSMVSLHQIEREKDRERDVYFYFYLLISNIFLGERNVFNKYSRLCTEENAQHHLGKKEEKASVT